MAIKTADDSPNWGGARKGAGRNRSGKYNMTVRVFDAERPQLLALLAKLRKGKK